MKTTFGMFLVLNHKKLQKHMLVAHAISYVWPSLKYSIKNLASYYKNRRKMFKDELPRIRKSAKYRKKHMQTLLTIREEFKHTRKQYKEGKFGKEKFQNFANSYYKDVNKIRTSLKEISAMENIVPHFISCLSAKHIMDISSGLFFPKGFIFFRLIMYKVIIKLIRDLKKTSS